MFAIKWISNNPITKNNSSGFVLNNTDVDKLNQVITFEKYEEAEQKIVELKKTASSTISFEVVPYEG